MGRPDSHAGPARENRTWPQCDRREVRSHRRTQRFCPAPPEGSRCPKNYPTRRYELQMNPTKPEAAPEPATELETESSIRILKWNSHVIFSGNRVRPPTCFFDCCIFPRRFYHTATP